MCWSGGYGPVSDAHLDVYKRQTPKSVVKEVRDVREITSKQDDNTMVDGKRLSRKERMALISVSYTHLDVYKRQVSYPYFWSVHQTSPEGPIYYASVSYTHLDVYKRQHLPCPSKAARSASLLGLM